MNQNLSAIKIVGSGSGTPALVFEVIFSNKNGGFQHEHKPFDLWSEVTIVMWMTPQSASPSMHVFIQYIDLGHGKTET